MIQGARSKLQTYNYSGASSIQPSPKIAAELPSVSQAATVERTVNMKDNKPVEFATEETTSILSKRKLDE